MHRKMKTSLNKPLPHGKVADGACPKDRYSGLEERCNVNRVLEFGPFRLDQRSGSLWHGSEEIHLTAKAYATLLLLVENSGSLVTKETLLEKVWPEGFIEPANLTQTVYVLRKTLGRSATGRSYIETIPSRGYRFVADVTERNIDAQPPQAEVPVEARKPVRRSRSVFWQSAALLLALIVLTLHSSAPSGAKRLEIAPEAQRDYILGRHYWSERTESGLKRGLGYFQAALRKSPGFAQAYSGLADSYSAIGYYSQSDSQRQHYFALAEAAARKGIAIDPADAESHASLAFVLDIQGRSRWREADEQFQQSIALNPNYATAHEWYSWLLYNQGKPAEALAQMTKARDLDPLSPIINYALGYQLFYQHDFKDAAVQWHQTIAITPYTETSYYGAGLADEQLGQTTTAEQEFRKALSFSPNDPDIMAALAHVYAVMRRARDARKLLDRIAGISPTPAYNIALVDVGLGQQRDALKWLAIAKANHDPSLQTFDMDPRFDPLRRQYYRRATAWKA